MAEKKIGEIKEELKAVDDEKLPSFIETYEKDERSGVVKIVEQAKKRFEKLEAEKLRIENLKKYEREYADYGYICGIDEVGRGPLAGPVVAGAVILPKDCNILYINDSKQLSEKKREELYDVITKEAVAWAVGYASPERIDEINILQATYEAMRQAIAGLSVQPDLLLVCLGAPKQELWMQRNAPRLRVGLMAGLGGSLDVFAGNVKRAPKFFQKLGLEWFYRLIKEPKRIGRMMKLPKFLLAAISRKLRGKKHHGKG